MSQWMKTLLPTTKTLLIFQESCQAKCYTNGACNFSESISRNVIKSIYTPKVSIKEPYKRARRYISFCLLIYKKIENNILQARPGNQWHKKIQDLFVFETLCVVPIKIKSLIRGHLKWDVMILGNICFALKLVAWHLSPAPPEMPSSWMKNKKFR